MSAIKRILSRLRLDKIASVDRPCQEGALAVFIKNAPNTDAGNLAKSLLGVFEKAAIPLDDQDGYQKSVEAFEDLLGGTKLSKEFWDGWAKGTEALQKSLSSIIEDGDVEKASEVEKSLKQFADYVQGILPGDIGKSIAAEIVASAGQAGTPLNKGDVMSVELKKALGLSETASEADVLKAIADKDAALTKANEDLEKAKKPPVDDNDADDADMAKALSDGAAFKTPEGQIMHKKDFGTEAGYAFAKSANARLTAQADEIAKNREAEEVRSFAKRAEAAGCADEFGETLRKAYSGDATAQIELEKQIAGLNKQVDEGALFETFGKSGEAGSSTAEFTAKVEEVKKAQPSLTGPQAYAKVYSDRANRDLVKRMNDEQRSLAN